MPISWTTRIDASGAPGGTANASTTAAFTPAAGERLLATTGGFPGGGGDVSATFTVADSQGLTWTRIGGVGNSACSIAAWISSPAAATSMTVTFDCDTRTFFEIIQSVIGLDGAATATTGLVVDNDAPFDGGYTITLPAAPNVDDLSVFTRFLGGDGGNATLSMGAGWTVATARLTAACSVAVRPASTSTAVTIADTCVETNGVYTGIDMAYNIQAAPPPGPHQSPATTKRFRIA